MPRKQDWENQLHEYVLSRANTPFAWGSNDCALFACDGIQSITGVDLADEYRGTYTDMASAAARIEHLGHGKTVEDVAAAITAEHGMPELKGVLLAQRGDVVLFDGSEGPALGLVSIDGIHAVFAGPEGLRMIPVRSCRRAWRV